MASDKTHMNSLHIPITLHGVADYLIGALLVACPYLLPFPDNPMKEIAITSGAVLIMYSIMTDYPPAILRFIPFPVHRAFDLLAGGALAFAPIHFAVHGVPAIVFIVLGVCLLALALFTRGKFSRTGQDNPIFPGA